MLGDLNALVWDIMRKMELQWVILQNQCGETEACGFISKASKIVGWMWAKVSKWNYVGNTILLLQILLGLTFDYYVRSLGWNELTLYQMWLKVVISWDDLMSLSVVWDDLMSLSNKCYIYLYTYMIIWQSLLSVTYLIMCNGFVFGIADYPQSVW